MWRIFGMSMKFDTAKGLIAKCQFFNQPKVIDCKPCFKNFPALNWPWSFSAKSCYQNVTQCSASASYSASADATFRWF